MNRFATAAILIAAPLLMAAFWMDDQPSYKAYETRVPAPPNGSVPISGREPAHLTAKARNPVAPDEISIEAGKSLFTINCALCHGRTQADTGPVGNKLKPPPPHLDHELIIKRSDPQLFTVITDGFGRMPPFRDKLTPDERWHMINFLRTR